MSKRPVDLLLDDICEAIDRIEQYISGMSFDVFSKDRKSVDAVVRNLEIIGEASNRLPADFKNSHSQIEWHKVVGLRHRIVHEYCRYRSSDCLANPAKRFAFFAGGHITNSRLGIQGMAVANAEL